MTATKLLVGTTKGLFLLTKHSDGWTTRGPACKNWPINHATGWDDTVIAVGGNEWWGAGVWKSTDGGENWELKRLSSGGIDDWLENEPSMADMFGVSSAKDAPFAGELSALWSVKRVGNSLYAGGIPGILIRSDDNGETWEKVTGLTDHESRDGWNPGAAGLTVHTILSDNKDPQKLWVGISAAGVFASEDGGATWDRRNQRGNEGSEAVGLCVHNMDRSGERIYQQNHHGVFRSDNGGKNWISISEGLPSEFGFPIVAHPSNPDTVFTLPLNGDSEGRYPPEASAAVWRSRDAGQTWEKTQNGLPKENCYFTVLRQAMTKDCTAGVYFGTNSGSIFMTQDEGDSWTEIASHLPTILSLEAV